MPASKFQLAPGWRVYGETASLQQAFDVAVIMPTVGRPSIWKAVQSVYDQAFSGRIQLLIGVDAPLCPFGGLDELFAAAPPHVTVCFFYPGYSTSVRHGGLHPARDGGALRAVLTYMAHARHVAYLDDDNWWNPVHLQSLLAAVRGRDWAYSNRWFVHRDSGRVICADDWESVGPDLGCFAKAKGGWVDPNSLVFDKLACELAIRWWTIPMAGDDRAMSADRQVYDCLKQKSAPAPTGLTTTYYALHPEDGMHSYRLRMIGAEAYCEAARDRPESQADAASMDFSFLLPTRNRITGLSALFASIEAMTARLERLEIILAIDEDDHASRDFVWDRLNVVKVIVPPGLSMGRLNQACYGASRGRYLMAMNDAVLLRTPGWDDEVRRVLEAVRDDIFLVHVNDKLNGQSSCCFPLVSRTFCGMAGGYCPDEYERSRIGDHIYNVFDLLGALGHHRVLHLPGVVFEHLNYLPGDKGKRNNPPNGEILRRDAQRFEASLTVRRVLAERLAGHIDSAREQQINGAVARFEKSTAGP